MTQTPQTREIQKATARPITKPNGGNGNGKSDGTTQLAIFPGDTEDNPVVAIVKHTPRGIIRSMLTRVPLSEEAGEIWFMGGYVGDQWCNKAKAGITATGYDKMNNFAGIVIHQPETLLMDDGETRPNPYFHYVGKQLQYVKIRLMGLGRNAAGAIVLHDNTVRFDVQMYLARDAWSKWNGKKKAPQTQQWGRPFRLGAIPKEIETDPRYALIECPMEVVLALDLHCKEVVNFYSEHMQRVTFAERIARTICRRNIYKTFFSITSPKAQKNQQTGVITYWAPVVHWPQVDRDFADIADLVQQAKTGQVQMDGQQVSVDVVTDSENVDSPDEIESAAAEEVTEHDHVDDDEPDPVAPGVDPAAAPFDPDRTNNKQMAELRAKIRQHVMAMDKAGGKLKDTAWTIMGGNGFESLTQVANCENQAALVNLENELGTARAEAADATQNGE